MSEKTYNASHDYFRFRLVAPETLDIIEAARRASCEKRGVNYSPSEALKLDIDGYLRQPLRYITRWMPDIFEGGVITEILPPDDRHWREVYPVRFLEALEQMFQGKAYAPLETPRSAIYYRLIVKPESRYELRQFDAANDMWMQTQTHIPLSFFTADWIEHPTQQASPQESNEALEKQISGHNFMWAVG